MTDTEIEVRLLGPGDHAVLSRVHDDVFDNPVRAESLANFLADTRHVMAIALDDDLVIGMCSAFEYFHPDKPPHMFLNEIAVARPWRRRGIGRRLATAIMDEARRRGCTFVWAGTEHDNAAARRLFERVGEPNAAEPFVFYGWGREG